MNTQPKFYIGSAMHHTLDREYSRQLTHDKLVQAELAVRFWQEQTNLYVWAPIPLFVERADYPCLELALIQEWQPRLNYPFICQFFHPRKGILKKLAMNTNAKFGFATLWRRAKHKFNPQVVKDILASDRFQNRLELWTIIHSLGSNTKARFEQTKMLRSNEVLPIAIHYVGWQTIFRSHTAHSLSRPSTHPYGGGRESRPHAPPH